MPPIQIVIVSIELLGPIDFERGLFRVVVRTTEGRFLGMSLAYGLLDMERYAN